MDRGFIKLYRKFIDSDLWTEKREFSKAEAWIDLLILGQYRTSSKFINGRSVDIRAGEIYAARSVLAKRWDWGEQKVRTFLKNLEKSKRITKRITSGITLLSISKYEVYNNSNLGNNQQTNHSITSRQPHNKESKEGKEINRGKKLPCCIFDFLGDEFKSSEAFCLAWAEWEEYRKQRKLGAWVEITVKKKAKDFMSWGVESSVGAISKAIASGWSGIFPLKEEKPPPQLSLRDFRICYKWQKNIFPCGSMDESEEDTLILNADLNALQSKYKSIYTEISEQASEPFGAMKKFLNKQKKDK